MPNWCENYIEISGDPKVLKRFYDDWKKQCKKQQKEFMSRKPEDRAGYIDDKNWVANLFSKLTKKQREDRDFMNCRGYMNYEDASELKKGILCLDYYTAWSDNIPDFQAYLQKHYDGIEIVYGRAEEGGVGYYREYNGDGKKMYLMIDNGEYWDCECGCEDDLIDFACDIVGKKIKSLDELDKLQEKGVIENYCLEQYEQESI